MASIRRGRFIAALSVAVAVAAFAMVFLVPAPRLFTVHGAAIYDLETTCTGIDTLAGTTVHFHWSAGGSTYFFVVNCSGTGPAAYQGNGTQGSGSFVSAGGVYEFGSACPGSGPCYPADVVGSYTGPLLPL